MILLQSVLRLLTFGLLLAVLTHSAPIDDILPEGADAVNESPSASKMEQLQTQNTMLRARVLQLQQKLDDADVDADEDEDAEGEAGQGEIENGDAGTDAELTQQTAAAAGSRHRRRAPGGMHRRRAPVHRRRNQ